MVPSPRRSAPCPLCFTPVVARELRLVRIRAVNPPRPGQQLTMTLIRRTRTSIIPQPVAPAAAVQGVAAQGQGTEAGAGAGASSGRESGDGGSGGKGGGGKGGKEKGKGREKEKEKEGVQKAPSPFDSNLFAKFVVVGGCDASELWRAAAEQLAACANQVRVPMCGVGPIRGTTRSG